MNDPRGIIYKFTDAELQVAEVLAQMRYKTCMNIPVEAVVNPIAYKTDLVGYLGELYVAKLLNVYPDLTTHKRSVASGTDEGDLVCNGKVIDVKTTETKDSGLFVKQELVNTKIDYYALVYLEKPYVQYMGMISRKTLCQEKNLRNTKYGWRYCVYANKLPTDITKW